MKKYISVVLLFSFASLCIGVNAAEKKRVKPRKLTTNEKIEQLSQRQQGLLQTQEAQQKQLHDMSQRLNAAKAAPPVSQSPAYSYP